MDALLLAGVQGFCVLRQQISRERGRDGFRGVVWKTDLTFLLESAAVGFVLFWMVGVWLLPEKAIVLSNYRLYMSIGVMPMALGAYMYERPGSKTGKVGSFLLASAAQVLFRDEYLFVLFLAHAQVSIVDECVPPAADRLS